MVERKPYQALIGSGYASPRVGVIRSQYQTRSPVGDILTPFVDKVTREAARKQALADQSEANFAARNAEIKTGVFGVTVDGRNGLADKSFVASLPPEFRSPTSQANNLFNRILLERYHNQSSNNMLIAINEIGAESGTDLPRYEKNIAAYWEALKKQKIAAPGLKEYGNIANEGSPLFNVFQKHYQNARSRLIERDTNLKQQEVRHTVFEKYKGLYRESFDDPEVEKELAQTRKEFLQLGGDAAALTRVENNVVADRFKDQMVASITGESPDNKQKMLTFLRGNFSKIAEGLGIDPSALEKRIVDISSWLQSGNAEINDRVNKMRSDDVKILADFGERILNLDSEPTAKNINKKTILRNEIVEYQRRLSKKFSGKKLSSQEEYALSQSRLKIQDYLKSLKGNIEAQRREYTKDLIKTYLTDSVVLNSETALNDELQAHAQRKLEEIKELLKTRTDDENFDASFAAKQFRTISSTYKNYLARFKVDNVDINLLNKTLSWNSSRKPQQGMNKIMDKFHDLDWGGVEDDELVISSERLGLSSYRPNMFAYLVHEYKTLPQKFIKYLDEVETEINANQPSVAELEYLSSTMAAFKRAGITSKELLKMGVSSSLISDIEDFDKLRQVTLTPDGRYDSRGAVERLVTFQKLTKDALSKGLLEGNTFNKGIDGILSNLGLDRDEIPAQHIVRIEDIFTTQLSLTGNYKGAIRNTASVMGREYALSETTRDFGANMMEGATWTRRPLEQVIQMMLGPGSSARETGVGVVEQHLKTLNPKWILGETHFLQFDPLDNQYFVVKGRLAYGSDSAFQGSGAEIDSDGQYPIKINLEAVLLPERNKLTEAKRKEIADLWNARFGQSRSKRGRIPNQTISNYTPLGDR